MSPYSLVLLFLAAAHGFYQGTDVVELTAQNFAETVYGNEYVWLVEFYAPWCGHCKQLKPTWEKLATQMKGIVKVAAVDCDQHREVASQFGIQGFPTIKLFPSELKPHGKQGVKKDAVDYNGGRGLADLARFASDNLPNYATTLKTEGQKAFLEKEADLNKVLLFTDKPKTTDLWKALSIEFHNRLSLGEVRSKEAGLVEQYKITKFPTLVVVPKDGGEPIVYSGKLNIADLTAFLQPYAGPVLFKAAGKKEPAPPPPPPARLVHIQKQADFDELCGQLKGSCIITALDVSDPGHALQVELLMKLNKEHSSQYRFGWIDGSKHPKFTETMRLQSGFPAVTMVNVGKKFGAVHIGTFEEKKLVKWLQKGRSTNSFDLATTSLFETE